MAAGDVQVVFDFECSGYGWSESWIANTAAPSLKQFYVNSVLPMAQKRGAMLAAPSVLHAISTSFVDDKQDSYLRYEQFVGNVQLLCDAPWTTVYSILRANGDRYRKPVYIRGQDDNATMRGGVFQPGAINADFVNAGTIFFDAIVQAGWGWNRSVKGEAFSVTGYVMDPISLRVEITCGGAPFVLPAPGQIVYKKVRLLFKGQKSRLNGTHIVQVLSANTCITVEPMAVFPFTVDGRLQVYAAPVRVPAENWNFQKSGRRMPGRPKLHTPGRRPVQARG